MKSVAWTVLNNANNSPIDNEIEAALYLVETLFADEVDKAGKPYMGHLHRVAAGVPKHLKAAAYMHDLVEDIEGWTFEDLADIGFSARTIDCIRAVTKLGEGEPYFDAMVRVGQVLDAIPIKRSDLRDNANLLRLDRKPDIKDFERVTKYFLADKYLEDIEEGRTKPGTPFDIWMKAKPAQIQDLALLEKESGKRKPPSAGL